MDSQNNNNQIITEKWDKDKIEFDLNVVDPFVQAMKDGIISIDDMQRGIKAALKTFYYNKHMSELHGRQICPHFTVVRKERTEKE